MCDYLQAAFVIVIKEAGDSTLIKATQLEGGREGRGGIVGGVGMKD